MGHKNPVWNPSFIYVWVDDALNGWADIGNGSVLSQSTVSSKSRIDHQCVACYRIFHRIPGQSYSSCPKIRVILLVGCQCHVSCWFSKFLRDDSRSDWQGLKQPENHWVSTHNYVFLHSFRLHESWRILIFQSSQVAVGGRHIDLHFAIHPFIIYPCIMWLPETDQEIHFLDDKFLDWDDIWEL